MYIYMSTCRTMLLSVFALLNLNLALSFVGTSVPGSLSRRGNLSSGDRGGERLLASGLADSMFTAEPPKADWDYRWPRVAACAPASEHRRVLRAPTNRRASHGPRGGRVGGVLDVATRVRLLLARSLGSRQLVLSLSARRLPSVATCTFYGLQWWQFQFLIGQIQG